MVGRSGAAGDRVSDVTARARSLPSRTRGSATEVPANAMVMRPASRSGTALAMLRYGTCRISTRAIDLNSSPARYCRSPDPAGGKCEFARLRTSKQDEFLYVLHRQVDMCNQDVRLEAQPGDRGEVLNRIERHLLVEDGIGDYRPTVSPGAAYTHRVLPLRRDRSLGCRLRPLTFSITTGVPRAFGELIPDQTRDSICRATSRKTNEQSDRLCRIVRLRNRVTCHSAAAM